VGKLSQKLELDYCDEYFDLVPRPNAVERRSIKNSILEDGQLSPIFVNPKGIILDGHTRWEICMELRIKPIFVVKKFKTKEQEKRFVIISNLARRNLTMFQKCELAWDIFLVEKEKAKARTFWRQNYDPGLIKKGDSLDIPEDFSKKGTAAQIFAKYLGTGKHSISKVEWLLKNGSEETLQKLRDGTMAINRAYDFEKGLSFFKASNGQIARARKKKAHEYEKICPDCECDTVLVKKRKKPCHVHDNVCCTTCKWGY